MFKFMLVKNSIQNHMWRIKEECFRLFWHKNRAAIMAKPFSHYNKQTVRLSFKFQKDLLGTKPIFGECLNLKKSHNSRKTDQ